MPPPLLRSVRRRDLELSLVPAEGQSEVLRGSGAHVAQAVFVVGGEVGYGAGAQHRGFSRDHNFERSLSDHEQFVVGVAVRRMRAAGGGEFGLVQLDGEARVRFAFEDAALLGRAGGANRQVFESVGLGGQGRVGRCGGR